MRTMWTFSIAMVVLLGCVGDPTPAPAPRETSSAAPAPAVAAPPAPSPLVAPSAADRDPFVQPALAKTAPPANDLARKAKKYSLEQLRLVGIVGGDEHRAMLVDPRGKGWIVERGDRVGRAELRVDHFAGWRVDRIREGDVVLVREDATRADEPETRVLALHTASEAPDDIDD